jgi:hypothetical protein
LLNICTVTINLKNCTAIDEGKKGRIVSMLSSTLARKLERNRKMLKGIVLCGMKIWHREVTQKEKRQSYGATLLNSGLKPIYIHLRIDGCSSFNIWNIQMYLKTSFESFGKSSHHYPIYLPVTLFVFHFVRIFSIFNTSSFTYGRHSFYIVRYYCKPTSSWTSTSGPRLNLPLDSRC